MHVSFPSTEFLASLLPASFSAAQLALVALMAAVVVVVAAAVFLTRISLRSRKTAHAAEALAGTHLDALDSRVNRALANLDPISDHSADLAESLESLQQAVQGLRTLVTSVPRERARFKRRLLDVLLPTDDSPE